MSTERANNGRFLGAFGFLGFLGFLAFTGTRHSELTRLAWVSLLSLISLGVFIPFDKARVKVAIDPRKKKYLGFLAFPRLSQFPWQFQSRPCHQRCVRSRGGNGCPVMQAGGPTDSRY